MRADQFGAARHLLVARSGLLPVNRNNSYYGDQLSFFIVAQISSYAFLYLLRERPQSDAIGFSFYRRFQKKTVLWKSISAIREVWVPSSGSAFQFHFYEGQQLQIIATEETRQLIVQAKEMGIPIEEDAICKNMNNKERTTVN